MYKMDKDSQYILEMYSEAMRSTHGGLADGEELNYYGKTYVIVNSKEGMLKSNVYEIYEMFFVNIGGEPEKDYDTVYKRLAPGPAGKNYKGDWWSEQEKENWEQLAWQPESHSNGRIIFDKKAKKGGKITKYTVKEKNNEISYFYMIGGDGHGASHSLINIPQYDNFITYSKMDRVINILDDI